MTVMYILALALLLVWIVRILSDLGIISLKSGDLSMVLERHGSVDEEGNKITELHIGVFGSLRLPESTRQGVAKVRIIDITDPENPLPVRSWLDGWSDEDGMFYAEIPFNVPNGTYQYRRFEFCSFDLRGLHAPYQGERTFEFHVEFTTAYNTTVYSKVTQTLQFTELRQGYIEIEEHFDRATKLIDRLVEVFSDGTADTQIKDIDAIIDDIHALDILGVTESAYQSCLESLDATLPLTSSQRDLLEHIAQQLVLPPALVTELNDRHLRLSTMKGATDHESIGMPEGLTVEEQLAYLAAEYRKWRVRVTHVDPAIVAEATARLEAIARARAELI